MNIKLYPYEFSDGKTFMMEATVESRELRQKYCKEHGCELIVDGFQEKMGSIQLLRANTHSKGDGFKPGHHPGLNMVIRDNSHYQQVLKEKGLVETGNQKRKETPVEKPDISGAVIEEAKRVGATLSDREIDKIAGKID